MNPATYSATFGCLAHKKRFEAITNNLANVNTVGFKKDRIYFKNLLLQAATPMAYCSQIQPERTAVNFTQGELEFTGNELDVAISGKGFFKVQAPQGIRFTRKGNFSVSPENVLVTGDGLPVLGKDGIITIWGGTITIDKSGNISCGGTSCGQLDVVDFSDYSALQKEGSGLFRSKDPLDAREVPYEQYTVSQGYLELSNVNVVEEMVQMIDCLRAYEAYQKVIQNLEEIDRQSITQVGRLA